MKIKEATKLLMGHSYSMQTLFISFLSLATAVFGKIIGFVLLTQKSERKYKIAKKKRQAVLVDSYRHRSWYLGSNCSI